MESVKKIVCIILLLYLSGIFTFNISYALTIPRERNFSVANNFIGKWNMQTIVTKSNCPYVFVGTTTKSNLEIKPTLRNKLKNYVLKALWKGGKWKTSTGLIKLLTDKEGITERVTEFKTTDKNKWKAILIDHLQIDENNTIHLESIVIQYKNGIAVGDYKTFSILTKNE